MPNKPRKRRTHLKDLIINEPRFPFNKGLIINKSRNSVKARKQTKQAGVSNKPRNYNKQTKQTGLLNISRNYNKQTKTVRQL